MFCKNNLVFTWLLICLFFGNACSFQNQFTLLRKNNSRERGRERERVGNLTIGLKERLSSSLKNQILGGAWVAQSVKCLTLDLSSGFDLKVVISSLMLGSMLGVVPT